jgi:phosphoribosyl-AMP cyclohydrolase
VNWLDAVAWGPNGLIPVVAQDAETGRVLTVAWMNREALTATAAEGRAVYWSRKRQQLWRKGERSGYVQRVRQIRLDCDSDTILLEVTQEGGIACHTGRASCLYKRLEDGQWVEVDPVLKDPALIYPKDG